MPLACQPSPNEFGGPIEGPLPKAVGLINRLVDAKQIALHVDPDGRLQVIAQIVIEGS